MKRPAVSSMEYDSRKDATSELPPPGPQVPPRNQAPPLPPPMGGPAFSGFGQYSLTGRISNLTFNPRFSKTTTLSTAMSRSQDDVPIQEINLADDKKDPEGLEQKLHDAIFCQRILHVAIGVVIVLLGGTGAGLAVL